MGMKHIGGLVLGAAAAVALMGAAVAQPVSISTLPPGAINNVQAQVVARVVQQHSDLQMRVSTFNSPTNILASVDTGRSEFAWTSNDEAGAAFRGTQEYEGRAMKNLMLAATVFPFHVGVLVKDDGPVKTVADLKNHPTATGWQGFTQGISLFNAMLATVDLSLDDVPPAPSLNLITAANDLRAGKNMATMFAIGAPKVAELHSAMGGIRFLSLENTPETLKRMQAVRPEYHFGAVQPAPHLPGIKGPTNLLRYHIVIVTHPRAPEEAVYKVVKAVYENTDDLAAGHPSFRATDTKNFGLDHGSMDYHPGAIRYLTEAGVWKR